MMKQIVRACVRVCVTDVVLTHFLLKPRFSVSPLEAADAPLLVWLMCCTRTVFGRC